MLEKKSFLYCENCRDQVRDDRKAREQSLRKRRIEDGKCVKCTNPIDDVVQLLCNPCSYKRFKENVQTKCANCGEKKAGDNSGIYFTTDSYFCLDDKCFPGDLSKIFAELDPVQASPDNLYYGLYIHNRIESTWEVLAKHSNKTRRQAIDEAHKACQKLVAELLELNSKYKNDIAEVKVGFTGDFKKREHNYRINMFQGDFLHVETDCLTVAALGEIITAAQLYGLLKSTDITLKNSATSLGSLSKKILNSEGVNKTATVYLAVNYKQCKDHH